MSSSLTYKLKENGMDHGDSKTKTTPIGVYLIVSKMSLCSKPRQTCKCSKNRNYSKLLFSAMVAPELKQNASVIGITKTCAVLGCEDSKNLEPEMFFGYVSKRFTPLVYMTTLNPNKKQCLKTHRSHT